MADMLQVLEGGTYLAFIVGAIVAVYELRTMTRNRRLELMLRETEFFCSREFEEATVNAVVGKFEPGKVSEVDMKMLADYWDSVAQMIRTRLITSDEADLNFADVWEEMKPWIASWEARVGEGRFQNFEWMANQDRMERQVAELKIKAG